MKHIHPFIFIFPLLAACAHDHGEGAHDGESEEGHAHGADEILLSPADAARFGVKVEGVAPAPFGEVLKTMGEILPVAADAATVSAPMTGTVCLASGITEGASLRAGQAVATIDPSGVVGGNPNESARVAVEAAKRELDRLEPLLKDGIVTRRDYNEALRAYEEARAAYSPAASRRTASAPIAGTLTALTVADGQYVEAGEPIATVARTGRLTLRALVPASEAGRLPRISTANISVPSLGIIPLEERGGRLMSASPGSSAATPGYVPVYFSFDNRGDIAPGRGVEAYLIGAPRTALTVASTAIAEQQGEHFVYVKHGDHSYSKIPVTLGSTDGLRTEVISGLHEGDSVVAAGTTFLRLAEVGRVEPEGHTHH